MPLGKVLLIAIPIFYLSYGKISHMSDLQTAKQTVSDFHKALDSCKPDAIGDIIANHYASDFLWRGVHPFGELQNASSVASRFWQPLRNALTYLQRRDDIFFAGPNEIDGGASIWVVTMGHLMGLFDEEWLGIQPTGKMALLRYCSFNRVDDGKISETTMHVDIPHLMTQAGQNPFPIETAQHLVQPGPQTHDGLLFSQQEPTDGEKTLALINAMISDIGQWKSDLPLEAELATTWHDNMIWWGPAGIGATYTIERYAKQHAGPFRAGFKNRSKTRHKARLAEGCYGGFFGWPNFTAQPAGGFMGMSKSERQSEFRVIDIYRRDGDKLAENWVFIDLLHIWNQHGIDILGDAQRDE